MALSNDRVFSCRYDGNGLLRAEQIQGDRGELHTFPHCLGYCACVCTKFMSQLDRLLKVAARKNKLTKKVVELDGEDFTFWHKPLTIGEYTEAKEASKNPEDGLENAIRLFVAKALDESGNRQYQSDAIPVLKKVLPMDLAARLVGALQVDQEEEEPVELDMKSDQEPAKKTKSTAS